MESSTVRGRVAGVAGVEVPAAFEALGLEELVKIAGAGVSADALGFNAFSGVKASFNVGVLSSSNRKEFQVDCALFITFFSAKNLRMFWTDSQ